MALIDKGERVYYRTIDLDQTFKTAKEELEKAMIIRHLQLNKNNLVHTSKSLGISRMTLYAKLDQYRIKF